ncbi:MULTISPECIES: GntR family transcriptional regulator [Streptomyces violaceoruber group]|uniref:GntR family transcriptional regulator n=1 Tax=Streptomyces rubrogriseus TaxID=194673 RepID=A0ABT4P2Y8_9ACTN|nr:MULTISPECIES: GntR family transcriptional regulator [Streptomyces anthocyanicus group]MCW8120848.1 GntR family transcriptional regulator [Streptomyces anthocyanicus]MCZ4635734.1 GntR family transcriptional regulator [Streptomyces rubrogriseus]
MTSRRLVVADDLRRQITHGRIGPGERLPSESALADRYKVSTATLRSALAVLQGEGLVEKIHGKGNFVRRPPRKVTYVGGWGTLDPRTAADVDLRVRVRTTALPALGHLTALLKVDDGSPLTEFFLLSYEGESPHSLARVYVPRDLTPTTALGDRPSKEWAEASFSVPDPPPAEVHETVSARLPTPDEASTLRINTALAVLAITRVAADTTGRVVEAALLVFPGDRVDAVFSTHHVIEERQAQR